MFGIFFAYTTVTITECHFKDIRILPSKFSYDGNQNNDHFLHGHDNKESINFNDSIVIKQHGENETLHFRKSVHK